MMFKTFIILLVKHIMMLVFKNTHSHFEIERDATQKLNSNSHLVTIYLEFSRKKKRSKTKRLYFNKIENGVE